MIALLKGLVEVAGDDHVIVDVNGVGYLAFCSGRTLRALPVRGEGVSLHIETHVREDHIHLYGFMSARERDLFRLLLTVQGVGAKVALAILSLGSVDDIATAIAAGDKAMVGEAAGVGPKLATRIVTELKDRIMRFGAAPGIAEMAADGGAGPLGDAVSALVNLGYRPAEASGAVARVQRRLGDGAGLEQLIRDSLRELSA